MDIKHSQGVHDRYSLNASANKVPGLSYIQSGTVLANAKEKSGTFRKASNVGSDGLMQGFLFQPIPYSQKGWWVMTCYNFESTEYLCQYRAFQNGRSTHTEGPSKIWRLDDKVDLKDAYFTIPCMENTGNFRDSG